jgi:nitrite reductase (NADH) small subunit/3-phenylpropionate/trans-cinnamate dioxygenase ferredoxin subunit
MSLISVAKASDLKPGEGKVVKAGGKELALFNVAGQFHAIDNACPHRGGPLGEGSLEGEHIVCPWHGWKFHAKTGANAFSPDFNRQAFKVVVEGDDVKVEI